MTSTDSSGPRILIGASGSAAVMMLPLYLGALRAHLGGTYTVLMTHTAATFLPPDSVRLLAERVVSGEAPADWPADNHARLAAEHDILAVLPATANILSLAAAGAAPNRLAATILAAEFPIVHFPSMNSAMWAKPAVARNIAQLRADGQHVIDPVRTDRYDVGAARTLNDPGLPPPPAVAQKVAELLG
ncbi:flavoprotein [Kribbella sp. NPDC051620]|uniref:flavoprotein n=1 Tax=Kribbella sp. NPDC051620 TaxID=3364120 RepID=UPI0037A74362